MKGETWRVEILDDGVSIHTAEALEIKESGAHFIICFPVPDDLPKMFILNVFYDDFHYVGLVLPSLDYDGSMFETIRVKVEKRGEVTIYLGRSETKKSMRRVTKM